MLKTKTALLAGASLAISSFLFAGPAAAQDGATSADASLAGEIVVTAQRRSEKLQDVPLAITAVTPEFVTQSGTSSNRLKTEASRAAGTFLQSGIDQQFGSFKI